jgi:hypothetical protein
MIKRFQVCHWALVLLACGRRYIMVGVYGREIGRVRFHYAAKEWSMLGRPVLPKIPFIRSVEEAGIKS